MLRLLVLIAGLTWPTVVAKAIDSTYCTSNPDTDPAARDACLFLADKQSPFHACTAEYTDVELGLVQRECRVQYCAYGMDMVCQLADTLAETCSTKYNVNVGVWRTTSFCQQSDNPQDTAYCSGEPSQDAQAIYACQWLVHLESPFLGCLHNFGLDATMSKLVGCYQLYCTGGMPEVCQLATHVATTCHIDFYYTVRDWNQWQNLRVCGGIQDPTTPASDTSYCEKEPSRDNDAADACSFLSDPSSEYYSRIITYMPSRLVTLYTECVSVFCQGGTDAVCALVEHIRCLMEDNDIPGVDQKDSGCTDGGQDSWPYCQEEPSQDDDAAQACNFLTDTASRYRSALLTYSPERLDETLIVCLSIYCQEGPAGVCMYAESLACLLEDEHGVILPDLHKCQNMTTPPVPTTTPSTTPTTTTTVDHCIHNPTSDPEAVAACNFLLDKAETLHECMAEYTEEKVMFMFSICTYHYCHAGPQGVCTYAQRTIRRCQEELNILVPGLPRQCVTTPTKKKKVPTATLR